MKNLSDEQIIQVESLAAFLSIEQIADYFGIGRTTFYEIMKRQPEVSEHYKKGKAKVIANISKSLIQKAIDGDTPSIIFYLKTQAGWKEKQEIDVTSSDGSLTPWKSITAGVAKKDES